MSGSTKIIFRHPAPHPCLAVRKSVSGPAPHLVVQKSCSGPPPVLPYKNHFQDPPPCLAVPGKGEIRKGFISRGSFRTSHWSKHFPAFSQGWCIFCGEWAGRPTRGIGGCPGFGDSSGSGICWRSFVSVYKPHVWGRADRRAIAWVWQITAHARRDSCCLVQHVCEPRYCARAVSVP